MEKFLPYLNYIKKIGFKNYWYYLRLKDAAEFFGIELPDYEETFKRLNKAAITIGKIGWTTEEFANNMIDSFKSMKI